MDSNGISPALQLGRGRPGEHYELHVERCYGGERTHSTFNNNV